MNSKLKPGGGEQNLLVALRIRPLSEDEILQGATEIAHKVEDKMVVLLDPSEDHDDILRANRSRERQFVFDCAFNGSATQEEVYATTTKFLISNVISGYNATVFAYGATGAGKTYTMLGPDNGEPGIMAHTLNDLFLEMEKSSEDMSYDVSMSYLEIYNEMIRDLLSPLSGILDLREDAKGGVQVAGLSEVSAKSTTEVMDMLMKGNKQRTQEPTAANKTSSRSHAVLQVTVKQRNRIRNTMQEVRVGKLFLVDLAGSERAANTHNRGKRMVEGAHINRSLLALGNCINALSDKNGAKYVNYRDSKLTRILKDALGGNCKTVMIAHISPASLNFEESRNTLVYADRAKQIKTKVRRNVTDVSYHIAQYTNIINELRDEISRLRTKLHHSNKLNKQQAVAKIHAVQSEVLEAGRGDDKAELDKLRETLLTAFKDQMVLRRNLMELTNAAMEISLETSRNQLLISEWEAERITALRRRDTTDRFESSERDLDKEQELSGLDSVGSPDPEEVRIAREEMKVLEEEKQRSENLRIACIKELEIAKQRSQVLEKMLPQRADMRDQVEALHLLYRVHQLEIDNLELQSACFMREFHVKKKHMVITRHRIHKNLCDEIIRQQRELLEDHKIASTKELDDLHELYRSEHTYAIQDDTDVAFTTYKNLSLPGTSGALMGYSEEDGPRDNLKGLTRTDLLHRSSDTLTEDGNDRLFSQSRRARQIMAQEDLPLGGGSSVVLPDISPVSSSPTVSDPPRPAPVEDRRTIVSNTRNINALAAKKRSKVQLDLLNLERQLAVDRSVYHNSSEGDTVEDYYLSTTSLANHNKRLGELPNIMTIRQPSMDSMAAFSMQTETSLPPLRTRQADRYKPGRRQEKDSRRPRRNKYNDRGFYDNQINKPISKRNGYMNPDVFRTKYGGATGSESSAVSTPQYAKKRPTGTIPQYRKGDISVTGLSLRQK